MRLERSYKVNLNKRFSIAHFDNFSHQSLYYEAIKNSSQQFKDEIYDIYFGKTFRYRYQEQETYDDYAKSHEVVYGNVMGVEASDKQVDNLFKIQEEFGIEISLTTNQLNIPVEMFYSKNDRVVNAFVDWLQKFYDRGLRSCTLANNHIMRAGFLQKQFPEMKWKNTVNQQVSTAQQVLDYLYLGYNIIQLDRSLNRNMDELKRIKEVVENYKNKYPEKHVKTCMLVMEDCMPSCPFKREHDDLQIYGKKINYWESTIGTLSCTIWENIFGKGVVPRSGTNCYCGSIDTFKEYAELVDVFKYSGRLFNEPINVDPSSAQLAWFAGNHAVKSFSEIIENRLEPVYSWFPRYGIFSRYETDIKVIKEEKDIFFMTDKAKKLEQKLKNCKNQCYKCHLCERTFGLPDFDSLLEL
jgi:hypothetical protein